jgi:hypothetical protein
MTRDEQTPPPGGAQREKDRRTSTRPWPKAAHFRFARDASNRTVGQMVPRWMPLFAGLLALLSAARAQDASAARYAAVTIEPARTSIYIGNVTLTMPVLAREGGTYASTYSARVFPFFFYSEQGKLWIDFSDDELARLDRGETVDFTGHALAEDGAERRIEGRASRVDGDGGKIKVRVFVSKRIELIFNTTYRFGKS